MIDRSEKLSPEFSLVVDSKITLSLPKITDAPLLFSLVEKNKTHLREFLGWVDTSTKVEDTRQFIENGLENWRLLKSLHLSIWEQGVLVGAVGLHDIDYQNHLTSIGYWLDKEYQDKGIMTKSVKKLIQFAFAELNLHRLEIRCVIHNTRSQKIPERLGFQYEGILKEAIYHYGEFFDVKLYSLITTINRNKALEFK